MGALSAMHTYGDQRTTCRDNHTGPGDQTQVITKPSSGTLTDPFHPTFLQGETSVRGEEAAPKWNEQLSFMELFPPLTRGLRLRDDAPLVDVALATHVLDLRQISNSGRAGEHDWPVWGTVCPSSHQPLRTKTILKTRAP